MKDFLLLLICLFGYFHSNSYSQNQESYYPRILMVSPSVYEYDTAFAKEMMEIQEGIQNYFLFKEDPEKQPPNIRRTMISVNNFTRNSSARGKGLLPLSISERILFNMFRGDRNFVFLMDTCKIVETGNALKLLAKKYDVQHIIYFPELKLTKSKELGTIILSMKVYNANSNSISLTISTEENWDYDEQDENPELNRNKTAAALIHNITFPLWFKILTNIYDTNESYQIISDQMSASQKNDEEEFEVFYEENDEERYIKEDLSKCLKKVKSVSFDLKSLDQIFQKNSAPFNSKGVFQVIFNEDKSKFIAFCLDSISSPSALKGFVKKNEDVVYYCSKFGLISGSKSSDTFYGSLIRGVYENNTWFFDQVYYSKFENRSPSDCQTIMLANLYYWGYLDKGYENIFEDGDGLFGSPSRFNRERFPYEGLQFWDDQNKAYKLPDYMSYIEINDRIRRTSEFERLFAREKLIPFYDDIFRSQLNPEDEIILVYSPDRKKVIHPHYDVGQHQIRYFLFVEGSVFEWKYFDNEQFQLDSSGLKDQVVSQFNKLTTFDYGNYLVLGDLHFWNTYVFLKNDGSYPFLSEISK
jgi:hypothetical protein